MTAHNTREDPHTRGALLAFPPTKQRLFKRPWLACLSGLSTGLRTKVSRILFPLRAHAWVAGQVPSRGHMRGNHTLVFLSFFLPPFPSL